MTIQQLRNEIETVHRAWYPEPDAQVWPLCLAKLVEETAELRSALTEESQVKETADTIIVAFALASRCPQDERFGVISGMAHNVAFCAWKYAFLGTLNNDCPEWLESRWNEVKERTPEVQRERDRERGIEIIESGSQAEIDAKNAIERFRPSRIEIEEGMNR